jgi:hypothetical protein
MKMKRIAFESVPEMIKRAIFMAQSGYTMEEIEKFVDTLIFLDMLDKTTARDMLYMAKNVFNGVEYEI